jgi:hydroxyacylglutathione hydrolase
MIPGLEVYGHEVDQCEGCTRFVSDGEEFNFDDIVIRCIHTPGHTQGHICYYLTTGDQKVVFTGDILFNGGAGRFFEGNAQDVYGGFQKLVALPQDTAVYCGHEYTLSNYRFALSIDGDNLDLVEVNINYFVCLLQFFRAECLICVSRLTTRPLVV